MAVNVYDLDGNVKKKIELPEVFKTEYKPSVIKRVVLALQSNRRQKYGSDPRAGKRTSAHYHGKRRKRFTMMNREMSRIPRIHGKVGMLGFRARFAPHAVKGRRAHPPKAEKNWVQKANKKEVELSLKSALAAAASLDMVRSHGYYAEPGSPIIFINDFENLEKTKDVFRVLNAVGLEKDLSRAKEKKVRAGKGKRRGRKYKKKKGVLIVVSNDCKLLKAAKNLAGTDVCTVNSLNTELLAPGAQAGRLTVLTEASLEALKKRFGG
jgi:large subunit ribosomal protein L4e